MDLNAAAAAAGTKWLIRQKKLGQRGLERERESYFALSNQSSLEREEIYQQLLYGQAQANFLSKAYLISL